jgi:hypothetical protein
LQERFDEAATIARSLQRAGLESGVYYTLLKEARAAGASQDLEEFLATKGAYGRFKSRQAGLIGKLFIPSLAMLEFRNRAQAISAETGIWDHRNLLAFGKWFEDLTSPGPFRGRRKIFPNDATQAPPVRTGDMTISGRACRKLGIEPERSKEIQKSDSNAKPHWDADLKELWFNGMLCKRYKRVAVDQQTILATFQDDDWPSRIDDPLTPGILKDTIDNMRKVFRFTPIEFCADGTGKGVLWRTR